MLISALSWIASRFKPEPFSTKYKDMLHDCTEDAFTDAYNDFTETADTNNKLVSLYKPEPDSTEDNSVLNDCAEDAEDACHNVPVN